ncbi:hypothetical protein OAO68_04045 [Alphaproteobacteria bacterium]|jgi:hypothetical protein|nr:hypothetical protein [Alphaproteobacteria bacterium]MDA9649110.1 hypothetical protein [Alphaproteobacteria bacterium]MDB2700858.1 hypothetical protein [Alphaproteobacteria bacterium]MDC0092933.1 hypothetical protein [Alphaproteobacteria bacterium]MDC0544251.1 hypothetical protein [Alphaproteobacteria bacterium]|tara:strand:+ start:395 stop:679 length:285 start_codon:yes stop_codon:yes gene_type:complete
MYARIAEFQSSSKVNCDMLVAFFQNVMIPRNIKNGQLSCEIYRVSETTGFVISSFKNKNDANKIMKIMSEELNEVKGNTRIKLLEGERVLRVDQ